jgi:hypothetical protein
MGRGADDTASPPHPIRKDRDGYSVIQPGVPDDIGTEAHRRRLESYARARTGRRDIYLSLANFCASCTHTLEDHRYGHCNGDQDCRCEEHVPGGGSFTDMKGNITVQSDVPPDGDPGSRELAMRGLLRHEVCHELYTSRAVFEKFAEESSRMRGNEQEITAATIQKYWNILEDGMIEERERHLRMGSYEYISALNRVWPRVGKDQTTKSEIMVPMPEGYVAEDADGNPLTEKRELPTPSGEMKEMLYVPPGTRISTWGEKPLSKIQQFEAALLAESVPEFSPGILHPDVQAALDECQEHIDAAVRGNTSDCLARAYMIHAIAKKHGLAPDDLTPEEREGIGRIKRELEEGEIITPGPPGGGEGEGEEKGKGPKGIPQPSNGMPDGSEMSDEMKEALKNGQGEPNNDRTDTYDPSAPLPEGSRQEAEKGEKGKVDGEKLDEKKKEAEKELENDGKKEKAEQTRKVASGKLEADNWQLPYGGTVPEREIASDVRASDGSNLMEEKPDMASLGRQLADRLSRMDTQTRAPERKRKRGRFDQRRTSNLVAYDPRVFKNKGQELDIDMEIDVSIDRSGSVKFDPEANSRQYDMAKTIGYASKYTKVPISLYGWCSGHGGIDHFAFKESHSDDLSAIDGFSFCGGGGTPTDAGIEFSRVRLRNSKKKNKVMLVVTDGEANSSLTSPGVSPLDAARAQVEKARAENIQVIGIGLGVSDKAMNETFGPGGWQNIEDYREVPRIVADLIENAAKKVSGVR